MNEKINLGKLVNACSTCRTSIYEIEPVYISFTGQHWGLTGGTYAGLEKKNIISSLAGIARFGGFTGAYGKNENSEAWIQCAWCYDQWKLETKENLWFWPKWVAGGLLSDLILLVILEFRKPKSEKLLEEGIFHSLLKYNLFSTKKFWKIPSIKINISRFFSFIFIFALTILIGFIIHPRVNRYKIREKEVKEEK